MLFRVNSNTFMYYGRLSLRFGFFNTQVQKNILDLKSNCMQLLCTAIEKSVRTTYGQYKILVGHKKSILYLNIEDTIYCITGTVLHTDRIGIISGSCLLRSVNGYLLQVTT
jgi:hypothetical protein